MSGVVAGLIGSLKAVIAAITNRFFYFQTSTVYQWEFSDSISAVDSSGNTYLAGGLPSSGVSNFAKYSNTITKLKKDGTVEWSRKLTGLTAGYANSRFRSIFCDSTDGIYISFFYGSNPDYPWAGCLKLDSTGALIWQFMPNNYQHESGGLSLAGVGADGQRRLAFSTMYVDFGGNAYPSQTYVHWIHADTGIPYSLISTWASNQFNSPDLVGPPALITSGPAAGSVLVPYAYQVGSVGGSAKGFQLTDSVNQYVTYSVGNIVSDSAGDIYLPRIFSGGSRLMYDATNINSNYFPFGPTSIVKVSNLTTTPTVVWGKQYAVSTGLYAGIDRQQSLAIDKLGGTSGYLYIVGQGGYSATTGSYGVHVLKVNGSDGAIVWARAFSTTSATGPNSAFPCGPQSISVIGTENTAEITISMQAGIFKLRGDGTIVGPAMLSGGATIAYLDAPTVTATNISKSIIYTSTPEAIVANTVTQNPVTLALTPYTPTSYNTAYQYYN